MGIFGTPRVGARNMRQRFRTLNEQMKHDYREALRLQAEELAGNIRSAIEHSESHHLEQSVRVVDNSSPDGTKISFLVMAGGPSTTHAVVKGGYRYDYALAEEFGTMKEDPHPFFYTEVRRYRDIFLDGARETLDQAIAENNSTRAALLDNDHVLTGRAVGRFGVQLKTNITISHGYRGTMVLHNQ